MEQYDYKQEINQTRKGCLGGSDGNLLSQIATIVRFVCRIYERMKKNITLKSNGINANEVYMIQTRPYED